MNFKRNRRYFLRKAYIAFVLMLLIGIGLLVGGYFLPNLSLYFYIAGGAAAFFGFLLIIIKKARTPSDKEIDDIFNNLVKNSVTRAREVLGLPGDAALAGGNASGAAIKQDKPEQNGSGKETAHKTEEKKAAEEKKNVQAVYKTEIDAQGNIVQKVEYPQDRKPVHDSTSALLKILNPKVSENATETEKNKIKELNPLSVVSETIVAPADGLRHEPDTTELLNLKPLQMSEFSKDKIFFDVYTRAGKDKVARCSNITTFLLLLEKEQILAYTYKTSIVASEYIENVEEYYYKDIVSISTLEECIDVAGNSKAPVLKKSQKLVITTTAGSTLSLAFGIDESVAQTVLNLRKMVRKKRLQEG